MVSDAFDLGKFLGTGLNNPQRVVPDWVTHEFLAAIVGELQSDPERSNWRDRLDTYRTSLGGHLDATGLSAHQVASVWFALDALAAVDVPARSPHAEQIAQQTLLATFEVTLPSSIWDGYRAAVADAGALRPPEPPTLADHRQNVVSIFRHFEAFEQWRRLHLLVHDRVPGLIRVALRCESSNSIWRRHLAELCVGLHERFMLSVRSHPPGEQPPTRVVKLDSFEGSPINPSESVVQLFDPIEAHRLVAQDVVAEEHFAHMSAAVASHLIKSGGVLLFNDVTTEAGQDAIARQFAEHKAQDGALAAGVWLRLERSRHRVGPETFAELNARS